MIKIHLQAEPLTFENKVRKCGHIWMEKNPDKKPKSFWRNCLDDMFTAYAGICAYLAYRIPRSAASVDHFVPVSESKDMAYEWSNYRLASKEVNNDKDNSCDIVDPFKIENTYFKMNAFTGEVYANPELEPIIGEKVKLTIITLKLNKQRYCDHRLNILNGYEGDVEFLKSESPFIFRFV